MRRSDYFAIATSAIAIASATPATSMRPATKNSASSRAPIRRFADLSDGRPTATTSASVSGRLQRLADACGWRTLVLTVASRRSRLSEQGDHEAPDYEDGQAGPEGGPTGQWNMAPPPLPVPDSVPGKAKTQGDRDLDNGVHSDSREARVAHTSHGEQEGAEADFIVVRG